MDNLQNSYSNFDVLTCNRKNNSSYRSVPFFSKITYIYINFLRSKPRNTSFIQYQLSAQSSSLYYTYSQAAENCVPLAKQRTQKLMKEEPWGQENASSLALCKISNAQRYSAREKVKDEPRRPLFEPTHGAHDRQKTPSISTDY